MLYSLLNRTDRFGSALLAGSLHLSRIIILCGMIILSMISLQGLRAQNNAGIGTTTPVACAQLDITSTSMGLLIPRLTSVQMNAIGSPATGLLIYNSTAQTFYYYDGTIWRPLLSSLVAWSTTGNSGTAPATNFIGTIDSIDFALRTSNTTRFTLTAHGFVGDGTTSPTRPVEFIRDASTNVHTAAFRNSSAGDGVAIGALGSSTTFGSVQAYSTGAPNYSSDLSVQTLLGGKVGVKTQTPKTLLDINGDANLEDTSLVLVNGTNSNVSPGIRSFDRITGPGAAFSITGIKGGVAGKILVLYNTTAKNMTITNDDATSSAGNRIYTMTGASVVSTGTSAATLIYSKNDSHWHLIVVSN
jgi:hypothetical protein